MPDCCLSAAAIGRQRVKPAASAAAVARQPRSSGRGAARSSTRWRRRCETADSRAVRRRARQALQPRAARAQRCGELGGVLSAATVFDEVSAVVPPRRSSAATDHLAVPARPPQACRAIGTPAAFRRALTLKPTICQPVIWLVACSSRSPTGGCRTGPFGALAQQPEFGAGPLLAPGRAALEHWAYADAVQSLERMRCASAATSVHALPARDGISRPRRNDKTDEVATQAAWLGGAHNRDPMPAKQRVMLPIARCPADRSACRRFVSRISRGRAGAFRRGSTWRLTIRRYATGWRAR